MNRNYRQHWQHMAAGTLAAAAAAGASAALEAAKSAGGLAVQLAAASQVLLAGVAAGAAAWALIEARAARAQLRRDPLTGLANALGFREALERCLTEAARNGASCAVLYGDLVRFKAVNDTYGHEVGDALLGAVGERLRALVRPDDVVGRIGGDEWGIIVRDVPQRREATLLARRIERAIAQPFGIDRRVIDVGINLGVEWKEYAPEHPSTVTARAERKMMRRKRDDRRARGLPERDRELEIPTVRDDAAPAVSPPRAGSTEQSSDNRSGTA